MRVSADVRSQPPVTRAAGGPVAGASPDRTHGRCGIGHKLRRSSGLVRSSASYSRHDEAWPHGGWVRRAATAAVPPLPRQRTRSRIGVKVLTQVPSARKVTFTVPRSERSRIRLIYDSANWTSNARYRASATDVTTSFGPCGGLASQYAQYNGGFAFHRPGCAWLRVTCKVSRDDVSGSRARRRLVALHDGRMTSAGSAERHPAPRGRAADLHDERGARRAVDDESPAQRVREEASPILTELCDTPSHQKRSPGSFGGRRRGSSPSRQPAVLAASSRRLARRGSWRGGAASG